MTDFGLDDQIVDEERLLETLRWHGLLEIDENERPPAPGVVPRSSPSET